MLMNVQAIMEDVNITVQTQMAATNVPAMWGMKLSLMIITIAQVGTETKPCQNMVRLKFSLCQLHLSYDENDKKDVSYQIKRD